MKNINKKIQELNLKQLKGYNTWLYVGDTYKDNQGGMYGLINKVENEDLDIHEGVHLYKIKTGNMIDEIVLTLII